jgi:V8-like Glu-specific endopeptidase
LAAPGNLLVLGVLIGLLFGAFLTARAAADDLMPPPPSYTGQAAATPPGQAESTVSDTPKRSPGPPAASPTATQPSGTAPTATAQGPTAPSQGGSKVVVRRRCSTDRHTHVRVCRVFRNGVPVRVCTKAPRQRKEHCRKIKRKRTSKVAAAVQQGPRVSAAAIERARRILAGESSSGAAHASTYINADFTASPLPAVVRIYYTGSPVPDHGWCSGTLLKRGIVLTAAHCLYDNGEEDHSIAHWFPSANGQMQVVPGNAVAANGANSFPYGVWNVAQTFVPPQYAGQYPSSSDISSDWGIIQLAPASDGSYAGDYTGTLAATWDVGGINSSTELWSTGYPASGVFRQASYNYGERQFFCDSTLDSVETLQQAYWLIYPCKGTGGISGGPMFTRLSDGSWTIIGVHNRGDQQGDPTLFFGKNAHNVWADDRFGAFWNATIEYINTH